ncbi:MAG TPA: FAD-binding oxidoreductase [Ramlibacter sp.]
MGNLAETIMDGPAWLDYQARTARLSQGLRDAAPGPVGLLRPPSASYRVRRPVPRRWVDLAGLDHVLEIPDHGNWVDVEGGTTWRQLVAVLAPRGRLPAVVPESPAQAVGAALADVAVGAASFRYGPVHATMVELDVLLPDGQVVRCSDEEREDLVHGFPGSCGTLGYVLRARLRTVCVTPTVAVRDEPVASSKRLVARLLETDDDVLGIEGLARTGTGSVVRTARCLDGEPGLGEHAIALQDWLWRWDVETAPGAWTWRPAARLQFDGPAEDVVQDVLIPAAQAPALVDLVLQDLGIEPLWLCGVCSACAGARPLLTLRVDERYVNVGIWGRVQTGSAASARANRQLEAWVARLGGLKAPYAQCFLPSDEFDQAYDMAAYARLKSKYDPRGLAPHLYDKCVRGG